MDFPPQQTSGALLQGAVLGGTYRVGRRIGAGAMGTVYEATHMRLAGRYAIKVLQPDVASHPGLLSRFEREATITSQLRHPNIVSVLDFNVTEDGRPFLAMELLEGTELTEEIRRAAPLPVARALDLVGQVASALAAAHAHGIVHRDLKPQNLFLVRLSGDQREMVKVLDFGISKVHEATTMLTQTNTVIGTPQYMAPEQAMGRTAEVDQRTDQFALGAILYELLTGRPAFAGDSIPAVLYQVVHETPPAPRSLNPAIPASVEAAMMQALRKRPEERFATVGDFHAALGRRSEGPPERPGERHASARPAEKRDSGGSDVKTTFSGSASELPELGAETLSAITPKRRSLMIAGGVTAVALLVTVWVSLRTPARPQTSGPSTTSKPSPADPPATPPQTAPERASASPPSTGSTNSAAPDAGAGKTVVVDKEWLRPIAPRAQVPARPSEAAKTPAAPIAKPAAKATPRLIRELDLEATQAPPSKPPAPAPPAKPKSRLITDF